MNLFYLVPLFGVLALLYTALRGNWVGGQPAGNSRMQEIARYIAEGAMAFLKAEYKVLTYFVIIAAILLGLMGASNEASHWSIALAFVVGAVMLMLNSLSRIARRTAESTNRPTAEARPADPKEAH